MLTNVLCTVCQDGRCRWCGCNLLCIVGVVFIHEFLIVVLEFIMCIYVYQCVCICVSLLLDYCLEMVKINLYS